MKSTKNVLNVFSHLCKKFTFACACYFDSAQAFFVANNQTQIFRQLFFVKKQESI